jgi:hypothetical protein
MADVKTATAEIAELVALTQSAAATVDIETALMDGEYQDVAEVLKKMILKIDELTAEVNTIKSALSGD